MLDRSYRAWSFRSLASLFSSSLAAAMLKMTVDNQAFLPAMNSISRCQTIPKYWCQYRTQLRLSGKGNEAEEKAARKRVRAPVDISHLLHQMSSKDFIVIFWCKMRQKIATRIRRAAKKAAEQKKKA